MPVVAVSDAEIRIMQYIWELAPIRAGELVPLAERELGWNRNTTYTVLKRLCQRGVLVRRDPGFSVTPLVTREQVVQSEASALVRKLCNGSRALFLAGLLGDERLSEGEIAELRQLIDRHEGK